jgi:hypothetical protein
MVLNNNPGTALITGASSGIGAEFAERLAQLEYDLILVARREERLRELSSKLSEKHNVKCKVFPADLAIQEDIDRVAALIKETKNISMLINNAGFGTMGNLIETNFSRQVDMINVHVMAAVKLSRAALENMVANRIGTIINVSSVAGFFAGEGSINYCATKAYLITFSKGLQEEVRDKNIRVQALCPGFTVTEFHDVGELAGFDRSHIPKIWWLPVEFVVDQSLKYLEKGKVICVPGFGYRLMLGVIRLPVIGSILHAIGHRRHKRK